MTKLSPTAKFIVESVKNRKAAIKEEQAAERIKKAKESETFNEYRDIYSKTNKANAVRLEYNKFIQDTKTALVSECICKLLNESTSIVTHNTETDTIKRNLVNNFVENYGVDKLLNRFKTQNLLLAEFYAAINKAYTAVLESVDKTNPDTFKIEPSIKDTFFDDLDMTNADEAIINIRNRVIEAETDFINDNIRDKTEINSILKDAKDKIDSTSNDSIKESVNIKAKADISKIKYGRKKNIYHTMVQEVTESVSKIDDLREIYMENGSFNMDKITENVNVVYTFLECLNTAQIIDVDEKFVSDFIKDLKA